MLAKLTLLVLQNVLMIIKLDSDDVQHAGVQLG